MRPALVLLLVAAAAAAFFLALNTGKAAKPAPATVESPNPAPAEPVDPPSAPSLVDTDERTSATKAKPEETRTLHPATRHPTSPQTETRKEWRRR